MLRPYLKIWEREWIFSCAVKAISSPGIHKSIFLSVLFLNPRIPGEGGGGLQNILQK